MERPTGVTILAVLNFLGAAALALCALLFMLGLGILGAGAGKAGKSPGGMAFLMGLGAIGGVVFLICAGIALAVGIGLWKLRNWARLLTVILAVLSGLGGLLGMLGSLAGFHIVNLILNAVFVAVYAWIAWYMFQPHVKQAFGAS